MNILVLDTVLDKTYISLLLNGKKITKTIESDEKNYHSVYLIKVLDEILKQNGASIKDIEYLGANTGTGSFTGIRVGLVVSKIIANRLNIKTIALNTAEILSLAYKNNNILLDARRNSTFYSNDGKNIKLISNEEASKILENSNESFICDDSFLSRFEKYSEKLISFEASGLDLAAFELELAILKIQKNETIDAFSLKPTYIQTPPIYSK